ncbi:MAG: tryptophan-rich sensory protein [Candidatus Pacebacteria bacterium]|nr:tryptophan-rich sensory protein [Candidatus Paceibacterota bacterium]MDD2757474.1 tryptophan-rich sensory protein [Candidatus Paceibacterota bacterium]MDD3970082.1 tryptophan-rich sensory protein [Candidatus Paceibacterota bacterium]
MITRIFALLAYIAMIVVNFLATSLPINNRGTGEISDAYSNLFAPAGITFSIWGLIYLLLAIYVIYQFKSKNDGLLKKINIFFIITSIANILWIFAWHYDYIGLSLVLMLVLLIGLIKIADTLRPNELTAEEKKFIGTPFSIYFGWITVATIANVTVFLVSINWGGFGIAEFIWTSIILLIGATIGILRMNKDKSVAYGLVLVWAYLGILLKHLSSDGFAGQYTFIIVTVIICLALFTLSLGRLLIKNK